MKQWQQSHLIITATTIPVALLVCWLIYKKSSSSSSKDKGTEKKKSEGLIKATEDETVENVSLLLDDDLHREVSNPGLLSAMSEAETEFDEIGSPEENISLETSDTAAFSKTTLAQEQTIDNVKPNQDNDAKLVEDFKTVTLFDNKVVDSPDLKCDEDKDLERTVAVEYSETEQCLLNTNSSPRVTPEDSCEVSQGAISKTPESLEIQCEAEGIISKPEMGDNAAEPNLVSDVITTDKTVSKEAYIEPTVKNDIELEQEKLEVSSSDTPLSSEDNSQNADDTLCLEEDDSACEKDVDVNANNNNNSKPVLAVAESMDINGSEDSGCECYKVETVNTGKEVCTNGWHTNSNCESGEETSDESNTKSKKSMRPHALHSLDGNTLETNDSIEVFVEFPSERVGLLIGKQGRNIKQLKQDSGADVYVHEAPMRDDIQVLQICGTQTEIESCVSRIKRRFTDISLNHFDTKDMIIPSPNSSAMSPLNTPPPMMYPVTNISQLRLPDGVTIEVLVSAIADVDCVFVQQFTHPTFHSLANLERAMSMCYSEPSTPDVPHPVQVGLICAVQQQGVWYRAQIVQFFEETEEVTIRFMDYGGYATVTVKALKQIRADFVTLPFQATECYMDNISPPKDNKFCEDSVKKLQELLQDGRFQARVTGYRSDGHPRIHLFKCLPNKVMLINQEMATQGLATWVEPAPYACE
uniref:KH domain-containing protein C56G2.1 n=1 Tax=Phallusia mammillata TaxID=59560 RepID=A0A6F9D5K6_9ASCI|nr:KH domain-containing protein C56G2.1 [Phallusia mammillata]